MAENKDKISQITKSVYYLNGPVFCLYKFTKVYLLTSLTYECILFLVNRFNYVDNDRLFLIKVGD